MYKAWIVLVGVALFTGCFKEEEPLPAPLPGDELIVNADMGTNYQNVYFYDIEANNFISSTFRDTWDLGFACKDGDFSIKLNGGKLMKAARTSSTNLANVTDTTGYTYLADAVTGNPDSTAIGQWFTVNGDSAISNKLVYIIDRGFDKDDNTVGFAKLQVLGANTDGYLIAFSTLTSTQVQTLFVPRNAAYNHTFVNLTGGGSIVNFEPPKNTWDLCFTQYTYIYQTPQYPYFPYLVTGTLINSTGVKATADSVNTFESIELADTANYPFYTRLDIIGYDWKEFDFSDLLYDVKPYKNYIIRSRNGVYYKMKFIDFYHQGSKGNTLFEVQKL